MALKDQHEPVPIVGMGKLCPRNPSDEFWELLRDRVNAWQEFDEPRFSAKGFHHPNSDRLGTMAMRGTFLAHDDARAFDNAFFGITNLEVETLDPSQRQLLEVTYEAFENAGETLDSISGTRTGVFVGNFCLDHWMIQSRDWDNPRPYAFTGAGTSILANRISYIFNLQGPSLTVDTACSSSMYALHLAMNAIRAGDCESAIVASANWIADPGVQIALDKLGALSASARCHTFDVKAEGYARGEGFAAIYLKKTALAVEHESPIWAMIRGTAINANGRTGGITRPSAAGQEAVIREAYRNAGDLPFGETDYFECHGTGTYVGDPIEVSAVGRVFASEKSPTNPMLIGSVKSNVGHGEGASALASIMKVVLALENGAIPPIYNLEIPNPNIDFTGANVKVVEDLIPWPRDTWRRASINSFGYGGANGHCIIDHVHNVLPDYVKPGILDRDETTTTRAHMPINGHTNGLISKVTNGLRNGDFANSYRPPVEGIRMASRDKCETRRLVVLPFSAHNESSLRMNIDALNGVVNDFSLADVAYTLGARRSKLPQRSFCIVEKESPSKTVALETKPIKAPLQSPDVKFVFTGQGAQWHAMGCELFEYRAFRTRVAYMDKVLSSLPDAPFWKLQDILSGKCDEKLIQTAEVSQVACTALQVALVDLLASWSIRPSGVVGHSSGEMAAAYAAGRTTAAEAILSAYFRGKAVSKNKVKGGMLAVGLSADGVIEYTRKYDGQIKVAAINSPGSVALSGDSPAIDALSRTLESDGVFNRLLRTGGNAYHSHHMAILGPGYQKILSEALAQSGQIAGSNEAEKYDWVPWVSSVTPERDPMETGASPSYWRDNLESPVQFSKAVEKLFDLGDQETQTIIEIGPHPALKGPLEQIAQGAGKTISYTPTLTRAQDSQRSVLKLAGFMFCSNAKINMAAVNAVDADANANSTDGRTDLEHGCTAVDLPPYQHDLLGSKIAGTARLRPQWRNILRVKDLPWLGDHRLMSDAVFPAAGYVAMAVEAAAQVHHGLDDATEIAGFSLRNVSIKTSLRIPEDDYGVELLTSLELDDIITSTKSTFVPFSISSVAYNSDNWAEHCTGLVKIEFSELLVATRLALDRESSESADTRAWYNRFAAIGLGYGPTFQSLSDIRGDRRQLMATAKLALDNTTGLIKGGESHYSMHPASIDGAIQLGLVACYGARVDEADTGFVPVQIGKISVRNSFVREGHATAVAHGRRQGLRSAQLSLQVFDANDTMIFVVDGLRCLSYSSAKASSVDSSGSNPFTRLVWQPDVRSLTNRQCRELFPPPDENVKRSPVWSIVNKLAYMVVYDIYDKFRSDTELAPTGDIGHFYAWIKRRSENDDTDTMNEARRLSAESRSQVIQDLIAKAPDVVEVQVAALLHKNMADILHQRRTGVDVIIQEKLLTPLYETGLLMTGIYPQLSRVLRLIGHANPNRRILEIGGGTGGATRIAMRALGGIGSNGIKAYRDYTFTDISPGFLSAAREAMSEFRDMNYSVLDVEKGPGQQGFEPVYDLVIACQVLHATSNMVNTLENCRKLLRPGGQILMVETTQNFMVPGVVVGTFTGYWHGIPDGRIDAPFMSLEKWDAALRNAKFSGADVALDDFPRPNNTTSVLLSSRVDTADTEVATAQSHSKNSHGDSEKIQLLHSTQAPLPIASALEGEFGNREIGAEVRPFRDAAVHVSPGSRVVLFLDQQHILIEATEDLKALQHIVQTASTLIVLTSCGLAQGLDPRGAVVAGLLRVLATENPTCEFVSIDLDVPDFEISNDDVENLVSCIVNQQLALQNVSSGYAEDDGSTPQDREFVWQNGCMFVSRLMPDGGFHSRYGSDGQTAPILEQIPPDRCRPLAATFETPGVVSSMYFTENVEMHQPLPPDYIDVAVNSIGICWKDLEVWSGQTDSTHLSSQYAGVVVSVGSNVKNLVAGDRVYGLGRGQLGNYTRVPAPFANKMRSEDCPLQVVTMPLVYATAIYALEHIAQLKENQRVLIPSATGNIGMTLIRLALAKGAEVFAVGDSHLKTALLDAKLDLPDTHIISYDQPSSFHRALSLARKTSFDVIVGMVQHELLHTLLETLSPVGRFVNVGRLDARDAHIISQELSSKSSHYCSIDTFDLLDTAPGLVEQLVRQVDDSFRRGFIDPFSSAIVVDPAGVSKTVSAMLKNGESNPVVVNFDLLASPIRMRPCAPKVHFDSQASYVVTGAFGSLGLSILRWMAGRGARHLVVLARSSPNDIPEAKKLIDEMKAQGVDIESVICDVADRDQVSGAISKASSVRPIKGVLHAAVSYLDLSFSKLSLLRWQQSLAAKVEGTWNLHNATLAMPLEFFVMTTSILFVYALATQSAYTAANNFQDAFARYRRWLKLPASTVSFSLIRNVGKTGIDPLTLDTFERNKTITLSERQFLTLLEPAFLNNNTASTDDSVDDRQPLPQQWPGRHEDPLSDANLLTCLDPAEMWSKRREEMDAGLGTSALSPRWHGDARVSLVMRAHWDLERRALSNSEQNGGNETGGKPTVARLRQDFDAAIRAGPSERNQIVAFAVRAITTAVAQMLFIDTEDVDPGRSVADHGVDSLIAAELRTWFQQALGANISMLGLLDPATTIRALAEQITDGALMKNGAADEEQ
ncbi:hypothetical protein GGR58DRAFT_505021 [Xylaria digitata]|nr:hypothetical protein GGR58DRAFT_505021 [Xylaria digitata]